MSKVYFIYKTTNIIDNKSYIGKHVSNSIDDSYLGSGLLLNRAIKKHGKENFKREILEICNEENLNEREIYWISISNVKFPEGYNIADGGKGGDTFTNNPNYDIIVEKHRQLMLNETFEAKLHRTKKLKGLKKSRLTKFRMSEGRKGMKFTEEHKNNNKNSILKTWSDPNKKQYNSISIDCYDINNNFVKQFTSITQAAKELYPDNWKAYKVGISRMIRGLSNNIKDYIFKK